MEGNERHVQEPLKCTGMEKCKPVDFPMTAEEFNVDDRRKTEAQQKVLQEGAARLYCRGTALAVYISQRPSRSERGGLSVRQEKAIQLGKGEVFVQICERLPAMRSLLSVAARGEYQR